MVNVPVDEQKKLYYNIKQGRFRADHAETSLAQRKVKRQGQVI